jgi:hypothetical protein
MTQLKMSNNFLLHPVLLLLVMHLRRHMCMPVCPLACDCERREDPVEKILLTIYFCQEK